MLVVNNYCHEDDGTQTTASDEMTQPNQSELEQKLDGVLAVFANYDESCEPGYEDVVLSRIERAKQAIKQLIADEMRELIVDKPTGNYNADSLLERDVLIYNQATAYLRTKLAEWLKETV